MKKLLNMIIITMLGVGIGLITFSVYQIYKGEQELEQKKQEALEKIQQGDSQPEETGSDPVPVNIDLDQLQYEAGETIGLLHVPKLDKDLPIIQGTDEEELAVGVGHYTGTAYPTQNKQIVLSGHRDTVFRNFDQLELGDTFVVQLPYGTFEYEIFETEIVDADDRTVIGRYPNDEILTVTTCYPFSYIGYAPDRFIFYAKPVDKS